MTPENIGALPHDSIHSPDPVVPTPTPSAAVKRKPFPASLFSDLGIILDQSGKAFAVMRDKPNRYALAVGGRALNNIIRGLALAEGIKLGKLALNEINDDLQAQAEIAGTVTPVWRRVAAVPGGIELDLGDESHTRVRVTPNKVDVVTENSDTIFFRPQHMKQMATPAKVGDLSLLKKYVNLDDASFLLFTAWLSYTLALPKISSSKYVILAILGGQGTGKSLLSKIVKDLIDPSVIGVQVLPSNIKDLSIAGQQSHVLCYDNLRQLSHGMADALCIASTGGSMSSRQLYSDADQQVLQLHVALVLNGIHAFIDQPDLAQRCLPLHLRPINQVNRKSEAKMLQELEADIPEIQRGLFDLISRVLTNLPTAEVTSPERMIDFCLWLAAMEIAHNVPDDAYQTQYSDALNSGQRDALVDNVFAGAILDFGEGLDGRGWVGTPAELLAVLCSSVAKSALHSKEWPDNAIALSKRLQSLEACLLTQGIQVKFSRGKTRTITIANIEAENELY